jgi:hypothetical protein
VKKMPLELARNIAVGGADEMQDFDDLRDCRPWRLGSRKPPPKSSVARTSAKHRGGKNHALRHDRETLSQRRWSSTSSWNGAGEPLRRTAISKRSCLSSARR